MKIWGLAVSLVLLWLTATPLWALQGHLRALGSYQDASPASQQPSQWNSVGQWRLAESFSPSSSLTLELAATATGWYRQHPTPYDEATANQRLDLTHASDDSHHTLYLTNIDRLNLKWSHGDHLITVGRQAIGFGRIVLNSPLDIIAPFAPSALITDVRPGIDALRWNFNPTAASQLQAVQVWGDNRNNNSSVISFEALLDGGDLLFLTGWLGSRPVLGLGLAGQIAGIGIKLEATSYGGKSEQDAEDVHDEFTIAAIEFDARLVDDVYLTVDYLFNGCGSPDAEDIPDLLSSAFYQEQRAYLTGRHYLLVSVSAQLHPLLTLELFTINNLDDQSLLVRPGLTASLSDNLSLDVHYTFFSGSSPHDASPTSEFGGQGDLATVYISYYF
jgi:hypothetical protein